MNEEVLIKVEGVSKKFCKDLKTSLWYGIKDLISNVKGNKNERELRDKEFWALKDITFEVKRGECLGLIGHNGAGKSTLLKILNGLINPDAGKVTIKGRVGALIELGAGFNPILTGRENIYNNGAVLGFTKIEIDSKVEDIIDFAEIRDFIDMPVQNYSSGMKVRLGFAVAAQMEPDVLIIDEVLAVGDVGFRIKCLNRISELLKNCAVIFVSHSMPQIGKICTKAIMIEKGYNVIYTRVISDVIQKYLSRFETEEASEYGNGKCQLLSFEVLGAEYAENVYYINKGGFFHFQMQLLIDNKYEKLNCILLFHDLEIKTIASGSSIEQDILINNIGDKITLEVKIPNYLVGGKYSMSFEIHELKKVNNNHLLGDLLLSKRNLIKLVSKGYRLSYHCPVQFTGQWMVT